MIPLSLLGRLSPAHFAHRRPGAPRILVIGGHQSAAVAHAMECLAPGAHVTFVPSAGLSRRKILRRRFLAAFDHHDIVFTGADLIPLWSNGSGADRVGHARFRIVPTISFAAFHPDRICIAFGNGALTCGPMGRSQSALVLFGFLAGLSPAEVATLFQGRAFERVGYFDAWDASVEHLRRIGVAADYDLDASLVRWMRRGCFMHAPDQIKRYVAVDLARGLLERAGVPQFQCNLEDYISEDPGHMESWPVYPEIAIQYGVPGSALFLRPAQTRHGARSTLSRRRFIDESFAAYGRVPRAMLANRRVSEWLDDTALRTDLLRIAKGA